MLHSTIPVNPMDDHWVGTAAVSIFNQAWRDRLAMDDSESRAPFDRALINVLSKVFENRRARRFGDSDSARFICA